LRRSMSFLRVMAVVGLVAFLSGMSSPVSDDVSVVMQEVLLAFEAWCCGGAKFSPDYEPKEPNWIFRACMLPT
jgi:hypothetical protein